MVTLYIMFLGLACLYFQKLRSSLAFYFLLIGTAFLILLPSLYIILDRNPVEWMILFLFSTPNKVNFLYIYLM